jgi:hypothetical protein
MMLSFSQASVMWLTQSIAFVLAGPRAYGSHTAVEGLPRARTMTRKEAALWQMTPIFPPLQDTPEARTRDPKVDWRDVIAHYRPVA